MFRFTLFVFVFVFCVYSTVNGAVSAPQYLIEANYDDVNCTGDIVQGQAFVTNVCINDTGNYYFYTCNSTSYTITDCDDSACSINCESEFYDFSYGCEDSENYLCGPDPRQNTNVAFIATYQTKFCNDTPIEIDFEQTYVCFDGEMAVCTNTEVQLLEFPDGNGTCTLDSLVDETLNKTGCEYSDGFYSILQCANISTTTSGSTSASSAGTSSKGTSAAGTSNAGTSNAGTSNAGTSNSGTSNTGTSNSGTSSNDRSSANIGVAVSFVTLFALLFNAF